MKPQRTFTLRRVLAEQVRTIRLKRNQDVATLSSVTGLSPECLKSIESAQHNANLDDLTRLSIGLGIAPDRLIRKAKHATHTDDSEPVVILRSHFLSLMKATFPDDMDSVVNYLELCGASFIDGG